MKKQIALIIVIMLVMIKLSGCTTQETKHNDDTTDEISVFVGTWKLSNVSSLHMGASTYTFFSDGTCSVPYIITMSGIWELKDNKLVIEIPSESLIFVSYYSFSDNFRTLTLTNVDSNDESVLIKQ